MLEHGMEELERCQRSSTLPERPDYTGADALVINVYRNQVSEVARLATHEWMTLQPAARRYES